MDEDQSRAIRLIDVASSLLFLLDDTWLPLGVVKLGLLNLNVRRLGLLYLLLVDADCIGRPDEVHDVFLLLEHDRIVLSRFNFNRKLLQGVTVLFISSLQPVAFLVENSEHRNKVTWGRFR